MRLKGSLKSSRLISQKIKTNETEITSGVKSKEKQTRQPNAHSQEAGQIKKLKTSRTKTKKNVSHTKNP